MLLTGHAILSSNVFFGIKTMDSIRIFDQLEDPRSENPNKQYSVSQIVFQTIAAVVSGCDHWTEIADFGEDKKQWISQYVEVGQTMPSHDTLSDFFKRLTPGSFRSVFLEWTQSICKLTDGEVVAIDGKTSRGSHDRGKGKSALHLVNAWASSNKILLCQQAVDGKTNEITAIPDLLEVLELKGALVTIDAMGCQEKIIEKIIASEADYLIAVKGNQSLLLKGIKDSFEKQQTSSRETISEKGHGRIETRTCCVIEDPTEILLAERWNKLNSVIKLECKREITSTQQITQETRYYICSKPINAKQAIGAIRSHWGIENNLHWILDVQFGEDDSRMREGYSDQNFAMIRKIVINLMALDKTSKMSVKRKRLKASRNDEFRQHILKI